jgi:glycosyltransferase involved in cell wall biosynthesis
MMKVLINAPEADQQGGVAHYFKILSKYFRVDAEFFIVGARGRKAIFVVQVFRLLSDYGRFIVRLVRNDYAVVHLNPSLDLKAFLRDALFLFLAKAFGRRTVVLIHGWSVAFEEKLRGALSPVLKRIYFRSDAIIVLGREFSEKLVALGYARRLYKLFPPVDDNLIQGIDEAAIARKYRAGKPARILFLARIEKVKGIYVTLEAMRLVQQECPDAQLLIAGSGSEMKAVMAEIERAGIRNCECVGYLTGEAKIEALWSADIYILPTTEDEGMPTSLLEAMAFGLPVLTRPVGGIKDFFQNEEMGFLTESTDAADYAAFIKTLLRDWERMREIGIRNHKYAVQHFLASDLARKMEAIYEEVSR